MVEPGSTIPDASSSSPAASPASSGKGWRSYSNNKKLAIGGGIGLVIGLGIYVYEKRKAASTTVAPAPGAGNTAPEYVLPSSNQDSVVGANDAALDTALGSIGQQLNSVGNDVNNLQPIVTVTNNGSPTNPTVSQVANWDPAGQPLKLVGGGTLTGSSTTWTET